VVSTHAPIKRKTGFKMRLSNTQLLHRYSAAREALEVEEGLRELRELAVEFQLWRRRHVNVDAAAERLETLARAA
jgi:hypothetical protein